MSKSKPITASELMRQLHDDPRYVAKIRQKHEMRDDANLQYQAQVAPILHELEQIGLHADLYELVQKYGPLSEKTVQLLLKWLVKSNNEKVIEGIVRVLGAPQKPYNGTNLVKIFKKTESEILRWIIANTIAEARPTHINAWLAEAVLEHSYGKAREMLILAVARILEPDTAISLLKQNAKEFPGFVAKAFAECGDKSVVDFLNELKNDSNAWEQKEIENTIHLLNREQ